MSQGHVHSMEVGSWVDGPGTRFVVFLAGCPLRCAYCHNPDAWSMSGDPIDAEVVLDRIARTAEFLKASGGGVTVSGGEPLVQAEFAGEILRRSHAMGLHTALDTSGCLGDRLDDEMLASVDLVLLDIKAADEPTYRDLTGGELAPTLRLARRLSEAHVPMWIRFVLVPGMTDDQAHVARLADLVATLSGVERVDVVPFHQMGRHKWEQLGIPYRLADTPVPDERAVRRARAAFEARGLPVDGVAPRIPGQARRTGEMR